MVLEAPQAQCLEQTRWVSLLVERKSIQALGVEDQVSVNQISRG